MKLFSDGIVKYQNIIIHTNGDFYVSMFNNDKENSLLNPKKYKRSKKLWLSKLKKHTN